MVQMSQKILDNSSGKQNRTEQIKGHVIEAYAVLRVRK